ncbi:MAG: hypothetical protein JNM33_07905 [Rubrivivax sp.]|nr:hypothetical protein [Rubrivivax sp.]
MNETVAPPLPGPPAGTPPQPQAREARIAHLFRGSRRRGLIHPLEHIVQQLRSEATPPLPEPLR